MGIGLRDRIADMWVPECSVIPAVGELIDGLVAREGRLGDGC